MVLLGVLVAGVAAERGLRDAEEQRALRELREHAEVAAAQLCPLAASPDRRAGLDAESDRLGEALGTRVTLIAPDGMLLGDSWVGADRLASIESHAERPEVREALAGRVGSDIRRSETTGRELHYVALACAGGGVVRVASEIAVEAASISALRARLARAGALGLLIATAAAWMLSS